MFGTLNPRIDDWRDLRVWIVGASTGIGAALARQLNAAGARVAVSARNAMRLEALAGAWPRSLRLPLDGTDAEAVHGAAQAIARQWGGLDMVVINAGTYDEMRAWELDLAKVRATFETNVMLPMNVLAATLPGLLAQGAGHVVLVGSVAGYRGLPKALAYGPSKSALINLAEVLFLDLRPRGIGVTLVSPGFVDTPLTAGNDFHMPALIGADEAARHIVTGLARGRFEIHFPRRFTGWLKLMEWLPYRWYFAATRRFTGL